MKNLNLLNNSIIKELSLIVHILLQIPIVILSFIVISIGIAITILFGAIVELITIIIDMRKK